MACIAVRIGSTLDVGVLWVVAVEAAYEKHDRKR